MNKTRSCTFMCLLPFFMPKLADEFLVTLAEGRFLIGPDQSTAVQEELGERRTGGGKQNGRGGGSQQCKSSAGGK